MTTVNWRKVLWTLSLQLPELAYTCKTWKQRMPNHICPGQAPKYLPVNKTFSPSEKNWKFVLGIEILINVRPTRKSVSTKKVLEIPKSSSRLMFRTKIKTTILTKEDKRLRSGVEQAILSCVTMGIVLSVQKCS